MNIACKPLFDFIDHTMERFPSAGPCIGESKYITHPDFSALYVRTVRLLFRQSRHMLHFDKTGMLLPSGFVYRTTIVIASITAAHPGNGSWGQLVCDIRERYPSTHLMVESVLNPEFAQHLRRTGWVSARDYAVAANNSPLDYFSPFPFDGTEELL